MFHQPNEHKIYNFQKSQLFAMKNFYL